ncbi:helix-turn-helix domain-containing protein [Desulforamulus aeronauticus]
MYNPREHRNYKFRIYPTKTQAETIPNLAMVSEPASKKKN